LQQNFNFKKLTFVQGKFFQEDISITKLREELAVLATNQIPKILPKKPLVFNGRREII